MKKILTAAIGVCFVFAGIISPRSANAKLDREIRKYEKQVAKKQKEEEKAEAAKRRADPNRRLRPYHTTDELYAEMDQIAKDHPTLVKIEEYGKSVEGRPLRAMKIFSGPGDKAEILFSGNIHAQELAGAEFCMALVRKLVEGYGKDCQVSALLDGADVWVIPSLNPDGNFKASREEARQGATGFVRKNKHDIDLNRNFPYPKDAPARLNFSAGSDKKWMTSYRGKEPLSEPESKAIISFIEQHKFIVSQNYHTTGGFIMFPPGTFPARTADDALYEKIAKEYQSLQFDKYKVFPEIDLYPTIGSLDDYIYHRYGILAFTIEIGKRAATRMWIARDGTFSPIFWAYNVYYLDAEEANLMPGALNMIKWAIDLHKHPEMIKWKAEAPDWKSEPALK
jgi:predicted deacylase